MAVRCDVILVDSKNINIFVDLPMLGNLVYRDLILICLLSGGAIFTIQPFSSSFGDEIGPFDPADMAYFFCTHESPLSGSHTTAAGRCPARYDIIQEKNFVGAAIAAAAYYASTVV